MTTTTTKTLRGTGLRVVEARAADGDTIEDSTLIGPVPDYPIATLAADLRFNRVRFVRCLPPGDAVCEDCTFNRRPLPPEPDPEEIFPIGRSDLATVVTAARDGRATDVTAFCRRHGLDLEARR